MAQIEVFNFTKWDGDENRPSRFKAERKTIDGMSGCVIVEGTGEMVDRADLDGNGLYDPTQPRDS